MSSVGVVNEQLQLSNRVREFCTRHYMPSPSLPDGSKNPLDFPAMRAEALSATECMVSIARVFKALETYHYSYIAPVVVDLSFGLSENAFWKQHGATLIPTYKNALRATCSAIMLKHNNPNPSLVDITETQKYQWHGLFVTSYDCLYGIVKSMEMGPAMLQELRSIL